MKHLFATFTAKEDAFDAVCALLSAYSVEVRREAGNARFEPLATEHGRSFVVFEEYQDERAFALHLESAHNERFNRSLADLIEGGASRLTFLTAVDALGGASRSSSD